MRRLFKAKSMQNCYAGLTVVHRSGIFGTSDLLGDVAGKGLGAALLSAKLQATLRALVPDAASLDDVGCDVHLIRRS